VQRGLTNYILQVAAGSGVLSLARRSVNR